MKLYRFKDSPDVPAFNSVHQPFSVSIDDLLAAPDAGVLIAFKAVDAAESMTRLWQQYKDSVEPVEGN